MESTTFALVISRNSSEINQDLLMRSLGPHHQTLYSMDTQRNERKFYDLKKEYSRSAVHCESEDEDELSGRPLSNSVNEDGYSSDVSNTSALLNSDPLNRKANRKYRKTKQALDSHRISMIIDYASDTDLPVIEKQQRKRKPKSNCASKQRTEENKEIISSGKYGSDKSEKRRSWTDSGVSLSLSRTDQSRCGTYENGIANGRVVDIINDEEMDFLRRADDGDDDQNNTADETTTSTSTNLRRRASTSSQSNESKNFNRLSQLTNRSSLTNVSILTSNSMSSLSSMVTPSEMEYITSDGVDESDLLQNLHLGVPRETEIAKGSQVSVVSNSTVMNCMMGSKSSIETTVAGASTDTKVVSINDPPEKDDNYNDILPSPPTTNFDTKTKIPTGTPKSRKRSKSFLSGFKKHFRPRFFSDKSYKDVSSDFSFEKARYDIETEQFLKSVTADVLEKFDNMQKEEPEEISNNVSLIRFDYDSIDEEEDEEESENDILEKLSSPPPKDKSFLGKIFKRSKSYSTTNNEKRNKKAHSSFDRSSLSRASVRSNPEHVSNNNRNGQMCYKEDAFPPCNDDICACEQEDITRARSMNYIADDFSYLRERSNSTPNTPMYVCNSQASLQGLNSIENQCSCKECLYADYLEFLEFQRFRRYGNHPQYLDSCSYGAYDFVPPQGVRCEALMSISETNVEEVIAPLKVTVETDKEAKTFRTSTYESFV